MMCMSKRGLNETNYVVRILSRYDKYRPAGEIITNDTP